ncbi:hypothetical protein B0H34DRAFT_644038, partial [Crassisporium funariophilum]
EDDTSLPQYSLDLGDGYAFLCAKERYAHKLDDYAQAQVVKTYFLEREAEFGNFPDDDWDGVQVARWARLRLPNGQTARSKWKEDKMTTPNLRRACCVKIQTSSNKVDFAKVQFYFHGMINDSRQPLALVSLLSEPDPTLLQESHHTVYSVRKLTDGLGVVNAKSIIAVIAVIPHNYKVNGDEQRYFIWEKMGMDMALLTN